MSLLQKLLLEAYRSVSRLELIGLPFFSLSLSLSFAHSRGQSTRTYVDNYSVESNYA